jgi:hypothetical protein
MAVLLGCLEQLLHFGIGEIIFDAVPTVHITARLLR